MLQKSRDKVISSSIKKKIYPSEEKDHIAIIEWSYNYPILREYLNHYPNGGLRNIIVAYNLKRMGVRKGISDFHLPYPNMRYRGLWIELKRKGLTMSSVSKEQKEWLDKMSKLGDMTAVAFGFDEAINIFNAYLKEI